MTAPSGPAGDGGTGGGDAAPSGTPGNAGDLGRQPGNGGYFVPPLWTKAKPLKMKQFDQKDEPINLPNTTGGSDD